MIVSGKDFGRVATRLAHEIKAACTRLRLASLCWALLGVSLMSSCAGVKVQRASEDSDGIPFYLQRPYVVVQREFPIEGEEGYLTARVNPESGVLELRGLTGILGARYGGSLSVGFGEVMRPAGKAHAGDETPTKPEEHESQSGGKEEIATKATATARWDPNVPQHLDVNDYFKVIFLPDLDEKYVISPHAGIGRADLGVAHGPGGVLNQFQINLDNTEIGKFVMETARKAVELAEKVAAPATGVAHSAPEDFQGRTQVVVRYTYVGYATPGIFPILKESEYKSSVAAPNDPFLVKAEYPYTRFSFRVRRTLRLVAEDLGPGAAGGSRSLADTTGIDAALASHSVAVKVGDTAYQATFTESKAQTDQVAIAYAIPEDAWTALEGLAEDKRTEAEGAMKAAILDAIRAQLSAKHVDAGNATLAVALVHPR